MPILDPDFIRRLSDLAARLDAMGLHSLADGIDESMGMERTATISPELTLD